METKTDIQNFYKNQSIFITGGTGFIGKVIIEKLLRLCWDVKMIYILVRPKRNKTSEQRFQDIFDCHCFENLKSKNINFKKKIRLIEGDCCEAEFGLSQDNKALLIKDVNIIIHAAADVKFDQELKKATLSNFLPVKCLLELAKEISNLKALVHVSTAYANCPWYEIREEFYEPGMRSDNLLSLVNIVDQEVLNLITPHIIRKWPNTYTFTKCLAEDLIRSEGKGLPITIVRPSIIVSCALEPMVGWIDNFYGITGAAVGVMLGVIKTLPGKKENVVHNVPCDFVANNIIAAAWDIAQERSSYENKEGQNRIPIYNYSGWNNNLQTLGELDEVLRKQCWEQPLNLMFWYSNYRITDSLFWFNVRTFFLQTVVSYVIDFLLICLQQKPVAVVKSRKVTKLLKLLSYFSLNTWDFKNDNVKALWERMSEDDKQLFNMSMDVKNFNWNVFWKNTIKYGRIYLLNEPIEKIPKARKKLQLFFVLHYLFMTVILYFVYKLALCIYHSYNVI